MGKPNTAGGAPSGGPSDSLPRSPAPSIEEMRERIDLFLLSLKHPVVTEPGREVVDLSSSNYSLSTGYNKLLWHIWNERANLVRQITAIHKESATRMELRYQRFGKGPPGVLLVAESRAGSERLERRSGRLRYAQLLRRYLAQYFPQWKADEISSEPDLQRSLSGLYTRGVLSQGQQAWAVIGAGEDEDFQTIDGILTYGLLWLDWLRRSDQRRVFHGLKIFVPPKRASTTLQRLAWMDSKQAQWEVYETGEALRRCDPVDVGNLKTSLAPAGEAIPPRVDGHHASTDSHRRAAEQFGEKIAAMSDAIELRFGVDNRRLWSIHGLVFARETARGLIYGVGRAETLLDDQDFDENFRNMEALVAAILRYRRPESSQSKARLHPFYRIQAERWMQSLVVREIGILGYNLAPDTLYEQVPALSGTEAGLMDLLAVDTHGRLAIAEFKASEDIHLPLQALDYWIRVHWHQQRGELQPNGYFPQRLLNAAPPLLLLVSPALQFHPACETILRYFSPAVEVVRIGLNEQWREGLQVMFRMER